MKQLSNKNQKAPVKRLSDMDPAGLAPTSLRANGNMLLYTPQARVRFQRKTKRTLLQEILFVARNFSP